VAEAAVIPLADPPRGMSAKGDAVVATIIVNRFRVSAQQLLLGLMRVGFLRILNAQDACIVLSTGFRSDNERRRLERLHVHEVCRIDDNPAGGFPEALAAGQAARSSERRSREHGTPGGLRRIHCAAE
jgi:hypothetical protein